MHHFERATVSGTVEHVFAHRFTVKTETGHELADLTPHGAQVISLTPGQVVTIEGARKPSEIRVESIAIGDKTYILPPTPDHRPMHDGPRGFHRGPHQHGRRHHWMERDVDVNAMAARLAEQGYTLVGEPRLRHRHVEFLAKQGSDYVELHVEFDGEVRKVKPADMESRWAGRRRC